MAKKTPKFEWNGVPVTFASVGSGKKKVRLGVHIPHNMMDEGSTKLTYAEYRRQFVMKQLEVSIAYDPMARKDVPGQGSLLDVSTVAMGIAEVSSFKYGDDGISFSLGFARGTIDLNVLGGFVGMAGKMSWSIKGNIEVPAPAADDDDGDDDDEDGEELPE